MSTASAIVSQANLSGSELLWTDTGSYGTIISRTLNIYDCNGNLLQTVNLGGTLTYVYTITADGFYQFSATIVDNTGSYISVVDYVAIGFYTASYLNAFNAAGCGCNIPQCNLEIAENFYNAALRFNLASSFVAANSNIIAANVYVNLEQ